MSLTFCILCGFCTVQIAQSVVQCTILNDILPHMISVNFVRVRNQYVNVSSWKLSLNLHWRNASVKEFNALHRSETNRYLLVYLLGLK